MRFGAPAEGPKTTAGYRYAFGFAMRPLGGVSI